MKLPQSQDDNTPQIDHLFSLEKCKYFSSKQFRRELMKGRKYYQCLAVIKEGNTALGISSSLSHFRKYPQSN